MLRRMLGEFCEEVERMKANWCGWFAPLTLKSQLFSKKVEKPLRSAVTDALTIIGHDSCSIAAHNFLLLLRYLAFAAAPRLACPHQSIIRQHLSVRHSQARVYAFRSKQCEKWSPRSRMAAVPSASVTECYTHLTKYQW